MDNKNLQVFIEITIKYFEEVTGEKATMGVPYIKGNDDIVKEYTGAIGISGDKKGCIYITSPKEMLMELSKSILGDLESNDDNLKDMIGEVANTIAGNARDIFGSQFMISVPIVVRGEKLEVELPIQSYVIPITWNTYKSFLVIGLEEGS